MKTRFNGFYHSKQAQLLSHLVDPLLVGILLLRKAVRCKSQNNFFSKRVSSEVLEVSGAGKTWSEQTIICMSIDRFNIY